jgi:hypothetical protein
MFLVDTNRLPSRSAEPATGPPDAAGAAARSRPVGRRDGRAQHQQCLDEQARETCICGIPTAAAISPATRHPPAGAADRPDVPAAVPGCAPVMSAGDAEPPHACGPGPHRSARDGMCAPNRPDRIVSRFGSTVEAVDRRVGGRRHRSREAAMTDDGCGRPHGPPRWTAAAPAPATPSLTSPDDYPPDDYPGDAGPHGPRDRSGPLAGSGGAWRSPGWTLRHVAQGREATGPGRRSGCAR